MAAQRTSKQRAKPAKKSTPKKKSATPPKKGATAKKDVSAKKGVTAKKHATKKAATKKAATKKAATKKASTKKAAKKPSTKRSRWSFSQLLDFVRLGNARLSTDDFIGIDRDARDAEGATLLHRAIEPVPQLGKNVPGLVRFLLERGYAVDAVDQAGRTALDRACLEGQVDAVEVLLEHGARVDGAIFHAIAAQMGDRPIDVTVTLERNGVQVELTDPDEIRAATGFYVGDKFTGAVECARVLLEGGLDASVRDAESGQTALFPAAAEGSLELVELFLAHGCPADDRDASGSTPLHQASRSGDLGVVRLLVDRGAKVGAADSFGFTPLHEAAERGNIEAAKFLLSHGASPRAGLFEAVGRYEKGATPRDVALRRKHEQLGELLG